MLDADPMVLGHAEQAQAFPSRRLPLHATHPSASPGFCPRTRRPRPRHRRRIRKQRP